MSIGALTGRINTCTCVWKPNQARIPSITTSHSQQVDFFSLSIIWVKMCPDTVQFLFHISNVCVKPKYELSPLVELPPLIKLSPLLDVGIEASEPDIYSRICQSPYINTSQYINYWLTCVEWNRNGIWFSYCKHS